MHKMLNVTDADLDNARSVIKAVARKDGLIFRDTFTPTHPIDFEVSQPVSEGGSVLFYAEVKCRTIKYDPYKISKKKLTTAFNISKSHKVPLQLWVWFRTDGMYASGMEVADLNFKVGYMCHGNRKGMGESCFDIPLNRFNLRATVLEVFKVSVNSFR